MQILLENFDPESSLGYLLQVNKSLDANDHYRLRCEINEDGRNDLCLVRLDSSPQTLGCADSCLWGGGIERVADEAIRM